ncbi:MAG: deoxynucleoside kinase [Lachnospiraceae bacterium]
MKGLLIYIFGIDGCGKTTLLKMLDEKTTENTLCIQTFSASYFTNELENIAKRLKDSRRNVFSQELRSSVWMLDLIYATNKYIIPHIQKGRNVILDRYTLCSRIYLEILNYDNINYMGNVLDCLPQPDLGLHLDVSIEEAIKRIQLRNDNIAPYEHTESLRKIKKRYEEYIVKQQFPIYTVDANQSIDDMTICALNAIRQKGDIDARIKP